MPTTLDVEGIWKEWDRDEELREIMHNGGTILDPPACQDISTCIKHQFLLGPLLSKMAVHEKRPLPPIDPLKEELDNLFKKTSKGLKAISWTSQKRHGLWRDFLGLSRPKLGDERFPLPLGSTKLLEENTAKCRVSRKPVRFWFQDGCVWVWQHSAYSFFGAD